MKVHPDFFSQYPELKAVNEENVQKLQGILNEAKSGERTTQDYMKPRKELLTFYLRTDKPEHFHKVQAEVKVTGEGCRNVLGKSMGTLFAYAGLPKRFRWGPEYWEKKFFVPPEEEGEDRY